MSENLGWLMLVFLNAVMVQVLSVQSRIPRISKFLYFGTALITELGMIALAIYYLSTP